MINRKKKLRLIQFSLFALGLLILFFSYFNQLNESDKKIISEQDQKKIEKQLFDQDTNSDVFYNISYSGLDLSGNRYVLNAKEAVSDKTSSEKITMKNVDATFYMKDDTILKVFSDEGLYNNKTLDMLFTKNVKAFYEGSELFAQRAEFSNSNSYLIISNKVKVNDEKGTLYADKLLFDVEKQSLNIVAFEKNKVNANISLKWKKDLEY